MRLHSAPPSPWLAPTPSTIAVVNELPESALYAAAGLADGALRFVGFHVSLDFHDHA